MKNGERTAQSSVNTARGPLLEGTPIKVISAEGYRHVVRPIAAVVEETTEEV